MMKKVTKSQVIAQLKKLNEGDVLPVSLFPSKCGPSNTTWVKGYEVNLYKDQGEFYQDLSEDGSKTFDSLIIDFSVYNCNSELGKRVHFYIKE
jgi:hypothetical protein